jgi:hypothetical protein
MTNLPLDVGIVLIGWSDRFYGPYSLPMNLTVFGLAGCDLLAEPRANLFLVGSGHAVTWSVGMPVDPTWLAADVYTQVLVLDGPVNPAHLTVSNGARIRLGL